MGDDRGRIGLFQDLESAARIAYAVEHIRRVTKCRRIGSGEMILGNRSAIVTIEARHRFAYRYVALAGKVCQAVGALVHWTYIGSCHSGLCGGVGSACGEECKSSEQNERGATRKGYQTKCRAVRRRHGAPPESRRQRSTSPAGWLATDDLPMNGHSQHIVV